MALQDSKALDRLTAQLAERVRRAATHGAALADQIQNWMRSAPIKLAAEIGEDPAVMERSS